MKKRNYRLISALLLTLLIIQSITLKVYAEDEMPDNVEVITPDSPLLIILPKEVLIFHQKVVQILIQSLNSQDPITKQKMSMKRLNLWKMPLKILTPSSQI